MGAVMALLMMVVMLFHTTSTAMLSEPTVTITQANVDDKVASEADVGAGPCYWTDTGFFSKTVLTSSNCVWSPSDQAHGTFTAGSKGIDFRENWVLTISPTTLAPTVEAIINAPNSMNGTVKVILPQPDPSIGWFGIERPVEITAPNLPDKYGLITVGAFMIQTHGVNLTIVMTSYPVIYRYRGYLNPIHLIALGAAALHTSKFIFDPDSDPFRVGTVRPILLSHIDVELEVPVLGSSAIVVHGNAYLNVSTSALLNGYPQMSTLLLDQGCIRSPLDIMINDRWFNRELQIHGIPTWKGYECPIAVHQIQKLRITPGPSLIQFADNLGSNSAAEIYPPNDVLVKDIITPVHTRHGIDHNKMVFNSAGYTIILANNTKGFISSDAVGRKQGVTPTTSSHLSCASSTGWYNTYYYADYINFTSSSYPWPFTVPPMFTSYGAACGVFVADTTRMAQSLSLPDTDNGPLLWVYQLIDDVIDPIRRTNRSITWSSSGVNITRNANWQMNAYWNPSYLSVQTIWKVYTGQEYTLFDTRYEPAANVTSGSASSAAAPTTRSALRYTSVARRGWQIVTHIASCTEASTMNISMVNNGDHSLVIGGYNIKSSLVPTASLPLVLGAPSNISSLLCQIDVVANATNPRNRNPVATGQNAQITIDTRNHESSLSFNVNGAFVNMFPTPVQSDDNDTDALTAAASLAPNFILNHSGANRFVVLGGSYGVNITMDNSIGNGTEYILSSLQPQVSIKQDIVNVIQCKYNVNPIMMNGTWQIVTIGSVDDLKGNCTVLSLLFMPPPHNANLYCDYDDTN
jgi:hypothetical protein